MKPLIPGVVLSALVVVNAYYTMSVFAPSIEEIHARVINARDKAFIIGASTPGTFCGLDNTTECPAGTSTQVDERMTALAVSPVLHRIIRKLTNK